jgi:uncharacterized protein YvpB
VQTLVDTSKELSRISKFWEGFIGLVLCLGLILAVSAAAVFLMFRFTGRTSSFSDPYGWTRPGTITDTLIPTLTNSPTSAHTTAPSPTPFQPKTNTPQPTHTLTLSPTASLTSTPTITFTPPPTNTLVPPSETPSDRIPESAAINGVTGYNQTLPLSCESRSAVDWARFFNSDITELDFQYGLPFTDNPNTGFVGDPRQDLGRIPPNDYGVHAAPIAAHLRAYGLNAQSYTGFTFDDLRGEISAGQPVIVWVIGHVWRGSGVMYSAPDGEVLTVSPYEHTVIVTGYTPDSVIVVDGELIYSVEMGRFLDSWSVLGNMVVVME